MNDGCVNANGDLVTLSYLHTVHKQVPFARLCAQAYIGRRQSCRSQDGSATARKTAAPVVNRYTCNSKRGGARKDSQRQLQHDHGRQQPKQQQGRRDSYLVRQWQPRRRGRGCCCCAGDWHCPCIAAVYFAAGCQRGR